MSFIDTARDALKDLPISDIVRERLSFALDRLTDAEAKIDTLQTDKGGLHAQLERERLDHKQTRDELQRLKDELSEDIRIHGLVEFRRGKRTGSKWLAFCPKCHLPAADIISSGEPLIYCSGNCGWRVYPKKMIANLIGEIGV